jgi:hypothetical protein
MGTGSHQPDEATVHPVMLEASPMDGHRVTHERFAAFGAGRWYAEVRGLSPVAMTAATRGRRRRRSQRHRETFRC